MIEKTGNDIFKSTEKNSVLFLNTNTLGFGATGIFRRLRLEFPDVFNKYHNHCLPFRDRKIQEECIGKFFAIPFQDSSVICFAFGQRFFSETKYAFDVDAFKHIVHKVKNQMLAHAKQTGKLNELHVPYKIGNGMSPEEVNIAQSIIEEEFGESPIHVVFHV